MGYGWGGAYTSIMPLPSQAGTTVVAQKQHLAYDGVHGGMQIGYELQRNVFVLGVETDFSGTDMKQSRILPI